MFTMNGVFSTGKTLAYSIQCKWNQHTWNEVTNYIVKHRSQDVEKEANPFVNMIWKHASGSPSFLEAEIWERNKRIST